MNHGWILRIPAQKKEHLRLELEKMSEREGVNRAPPILRQALVRGVQDWLREIFCSSFNEINVSHTSVEDQALDEIINLINQILVSL